MLFLCATLKAVDDYQDLLRVSVSSSGNDHRLGGNEAPPAIISVFLGDELTEIMEAIENSALYTGKESRLMGIGATVLPHFPKDNTDRNRTSPFAFTGNKFEFRMPGSSQSIAGPNMVINTAVAEVLNGFADQLENSSDFAVDLMKLLSETIKNHKRIVFNGNGYDEAWVKEAEKRGLKHFKNTIEALPAFIEPKNIALYTKHHVFSEEEIHSRYEVMLDSYTKTINIEALTMIDMVQRDVIPGCLSYQNLLLTTLTQKKALGSQIPCQLEENLLSKIATLVDVMEARLNTLSDEVVSAKNQNDSYEVAKAFRQHVILAMNELRAVVDELETLIGKAFWPMPVYAEIFHSI